MAGQVHNNLIDDVHVWVGDLLQYDPHIGNEVCRSD